MRTRTRTGLVGWPMHDLRRNHQGCAHPPLSPRIDSAFKVPLSPKWKMALIEEHENNKPKHTRNKRIKFYNYTFQIRLRSKVCFCKLIGWFVVSNIGMSDELLVVGSCRSMQLTKIIPRRNRYCFSGGARLPQQASLAYQAVRKSKNGKLQISIRTQHQTIGNEYTDKPN